MSFLLKRVQVIPTPNHPDSNQVDILIDETGIIQKIDNQIESNQDSVFDFEGAYLSIGWVDVGTNICDPGYEEREPLELTAEAAAAGGFTTIVPNPNTNPVIHSKSEVLYIKNRTSHFPTQFLPLGAISKNCDGIDLTEILDMHHAGAIAFSDGQSALQDNGLMKRALQYVKSIDGLILNWPHDQTIQSNAQIHEGPFSTTLGMKGIPYLAEKLMVQRDLALAQYTKSRIHLANISTKEGIDLIRTAKQEGVQVSASTPYLNLLFIDEDINNFDTSLKVLPPLRGPQDRVALIEGLKDGTIDFITTNHTPQESDHKKVEFSFAAFGATGLQTAFFKGWNLLKDHISMEKYVALWTIHPRKVLGLPVPKIAVGELAEFTVFAPDKNWEVNTGTLFSPSKNNPFFGETISGKVLAVIRGRQSKIL